MDEAGRPVAAALCVPPRRPPHSVSCAGKGTVRGGRGRGDSAKQLPSPPPRPEHFPLPSHAPRLPSTAPRLPALAYTVPLGRLGGSRAAVILLGYGNVNARSVATAATVQKLAPAVPLAPLSSQPRVVVSSSAAARGAAVAHPSPPNVIRTHPPLRIEQQLPVPLHPAIPTRSPLAHGRVLRPAVGVAVGTAVAAVAVAASPVATPAVVPHASRGGRGARNRLGCRRVLVPEGHASRGGGYCRWAHLWDDCKQGRRGKPAVGDQRRRDSSPPRVGHHRVGRRMTALKHSIEITCGLADFGSLCSRRFQRPHTPWG